MKKYNRVLCITLTMIICFTSFTIPARAEKSVDISTFAENVFEENSKDTVSENSVSISDNTIVGKKQDNSVSLSENTVDELVDNNGNEQEKNYTIKAEENNLELREYLDANEVATVEVDKAVVTNNAQFYTAMKDETVSIIQINSKLSGLVDEKTGAIPLVIDRPLTIQGGTQDATLNMEYLGIVLGADVTFKDINLKFATTLLDVIVVNGYQLVLENTIIESTAGSDWTISIICGGIVGYQLGDILPTTGNNGTVVIRGNCNVGNIYAGSLSHVDTMINEFNGNATILIEEGSSGSIGTIYGCGGRESIEEMTGNVIYYGDEFGVSGNIDVSIYDSLVNNVIGYRNNLHVTYCGNEYVRTKNLCNISSLKVENGKLELGTSSSFSGAEPKVEVLDGLLYLGKMGNMSIGDFTGGGSLVLGDEQKIQIEGNVTGKTKVYTGGIEYDGTSSSIPLSGYTYITAKQATGDAFVFQAEYFSPGYVPKFISDGNNGGSWVTPDEYVTRIKNITMENVSVDVNNTESEEYIDIPIMVTYSDDTTWKSVDFLELDIYINEEVLGAEKDSDGYVYYSTDTISCYTYSAADGCVLRISDETGYAIPREGIYRISVTVPNTYTENGIDALKAQATLTVGVEEQKIAIEKPVVVTGLVWNGEEQVGVEEKEGYTLSGDAKAAGVGTYNVTATLKEGYVWMDGSSDEVNLQWSIEQAESIKEGLWITGISKDGYTYTGTAIKPEIRVYDGTTLLREKTDYSVSYKNNTDANDGSNTKNMPTITVTGKGNYTGKVTQTFIIQPKSLKHEDISTADMWVNANNKVQKPIPVVKDGTKTLKNKTNYVLEYPDSVNNTDAYKVVGEYNITVTGKGNYCDSITIKLNITDLKLMSQVKVASVGNKSYTGSAIEIDPFPIVKHQTTILIKDMHYTVSYEDNEEIGTATAVITSKKDSGYVGEKRINFKIVGENISKANVSRIASQIEYTGEPIVVGTSGFGEKPVLSLKVGKDTRTIDEKDYTIDYVNNINKGTGTIIFNGINGYAGSLKKNFTIKAYDIGKDEFDKISVFMEEEMDYLKGGSKPEPLVMFGTQILEKDKDYTLSYKNNTSVNDGSNEKKKPTVIVKGKGNFTGSKNIFFAIEPKALTNENGIKVVINDKVANNKKNGYVQSFKVYDSDGKALSSSDYDSKNVTYTLIESQNEDGTSKEDMVLDKNSIVPGNSVIRITVKGKGNYANGEASATYRILENGHDISKATIQIVDQKYTGQPVLIDDQNQLKPRKVYIKIGKKTKELNLGVDIEVVPESYVNNKNKGTAKVTFRGINEFGGSKTVSYKIGARSIEEFWIGVRSRMTNLFNN